MTSPSLMREMARKTGALGQPRGMGWGRMCVGGVQDVDTCTLIVDSCQCMSKTAIIL